MDRTDTNKSQLAAMLGVGKSAVSQLLRGNGNMTLQTLAEYLGTMGYELEVVASEKGEISTSMRERRRPNVACLTLRDEDWRDSPSVHSVGESRRALPVSYQNENNVVTAVSVSAISYGWSPDRINSSFQDRSRTLASGNK